MIKWKLNYISDKISPIISVKVDQAEQKEIKKESNFNYIFPYGRLDEINKYEKNKIKERRDDKY